MRETAQAPKTLREKIQAHHVRAKKQFIQKHPHAHRFFKRRGLDLGKIRHHSTRLLTAGTLAGTMLLGSPSQHLSLKPPPLPENWVKNLTYAGMALPEDTKGFLVDQLKKILPEKIRPLAHEEEKQIGLLIEKLTGLRARATLEGEHLNTSFGLIGAEQHLPRFPGDSASQHDEFRESGVTPGLSAWGYFARSKGELKPIDTQNEKYYVAVQTLYLPDWEKRFPYLRDWYKYRKVLVLNPETGQAVVAAIADAGPASWTGKHFGGSPEVMFHLGFYTGPRKGAVLLFFVDDPENQISLGPLDYDKTRPLLSDSNYFPQKLGAKIEMPKVEVLEN